MTLEGIHLDVRGIGKSFGGTRALHEVFVPIRTGSVHAFVGENGAGKSTLGKIVAGVFPPDEGELILKGEPVSFRSPREALERGIALVAQEVAVVPQRTVAENVFLGAEPRRLGFVRRRALLERFERVVADAGFETPGQCDRRRAAAREAAAGRDPAGARAGRRAHRVRRTDRRALRGRDPTFPRDRPSPFA